MLLTAHADTQTMLRAINEGGIFQCVEKPWDRESLLLTVRNALERGDMVVQLRRTVAAMQHNNSALSQALRHAATTVRHCNQWGGWRRGLRTRSATSCRC